MPGILGIFGTFMGILGIFEGIFDIIVAIFQNSAVIFEFFHSKNRNMRLYSCNECLDITSRLFWSFVHRIVFCSPLLKCQNGHENAQMSFKMPKMPKNLPICPKILILPLCPENAKMPSFQNALIPRAFWAGILGTLGGHLFLSIPRGGGEHKSKSHCDRQNLLILWALGQCMASGQTWTSLIYMAQRGDKTLLFDFPFERLHPLQFWCKRLSQYPQLSQYPKLYTFT